MSRLGEVLCGAVAVALVAAGVLLALAVTGRLPAWWGWVAAGVWTLALLAAGGLVWIAGRGPQA